MMTQNLVNKKLTREQVERYLERLTYREACRPDIQTLTGLHQAHMENVPFENLDIILGRKLDLSLQAVFAKVVDGKRGGFCYEVNSLFASLLASLGFDVYLHSARVYGDQGFGPAFDHLLMSVRLDNTLYLADVGFGDSFVRPLCLLQGSGVSSAKHPMDIAPEHLTQTATKQQQANYRVDNTPQGLVLKRQKPGQAWQVQYLFSLQEHEISDFYQMCHYHQTSPDSSFTRKSLCSIATASGRKTLSGARFIEAGNSCRHELEVNGQDMYRELLAKHFYMQLPQDLAVNTWNRLLFTSNSS